MKPDKYSVIIAHDEAELYNKVNEYDRLGYDTISVFRNKSGNYSFLIKKRETE